MFDDPADRTLLMLTTYGPAVVAVVGMVVALRREPGRWRTVLILGLLLVGALPVIQYWYGRSVSDPVPPEVLADLGPHYGMDDVRYTAYLQATWIGVVILAAELVALALVVVAVTSGRPRRVPNTSASPPV